jgi:hypothetical protein
VSGLFERHRILRRRGQSGLHVATIRRYDWTFMEHEPTASDTPLTVTEESGSRIIEGARGRPLLHVPQDATLVLEACLSARVPAVVLYAENLTAGFFDLSSGEAGEILEKLRRFRVRLAVVSAPGSVTFSSRFREILCDDLQVFDDRADAVRWLATSGFRAKSDHRRGERGGRM